MRDARSVRNVARIIRRFGGSELVVVISAMGKTTNALERITDLYLAGKPWRDQVEALYAYHKEIAESLFPNCGPIMDTLEALKRDLIEKLEQPAIGGYGYHYDQIVSQGELWSTRLISGYLEQEGMQSVWLDARTLIQTDASHREGKVNWKKTGSRIRQAVDAKGIHITQGFIGFFEPGLTVTLGREGSDFTAAIFGHSLDAESVTIWKDVPGMLNADPKWFDQTELLPRISYHEAVELSYYGASVIHPKTLKPLQNKNIPLFVRSFLQPEEPGTEIQSDPQWDGDHTNFIFKIDQLLISIVPRDFSFIVEENLKDIFTVFSRFGVKVNLMQNSALSFSVCTNRGGRVMEAIDALRKEYEVRYNEGLELITVRHFDEVTIKRVTRDKRIYLEQRTRNTVRFVVGSH